MSTTAENRTPEQPEFPESPEPEVAPADGAAAELQQPSTSTPPVLSGSGLLRKGFLRWLVMGFVRLAYRRWTRLAVVLFPEDSKRAAFATGLGIPLPDRLNLSWVTPQLAVGGRVLPDDIHRLAKAGVTRVVDTRAEHQDDATLLAREGIELLSLPTPDTHPLSVVQLREGAAWVNQQIATGQRVLIHCEHGVGRSVLLTAAALVAAGVSAHDAMSLIQRRRWQAAPNHRQMRRLQEFERAVHGRTTVAAEADFTAS
jgi:protein tyrosine phosphatase (PTP) superfamily phosphohydrolase (DUF442 family)